ncbi:MAG TPA: glycine zipper domain-containing protein [Gemmataceae bacterium]|nr:glycine zipper domain-containing protein [Gemmataceae bacterium]
MVSINKPQAGKWQRRILIGAALAPFLLATGCETAAGTGMLAGGGLGALAGGAIGAATHHAGEGALIGAAAGATLGGVTGAAVDNHNVKVAAKDAQQRRAQVIQDVVTLTHQGTSDQIIINEVQTAGLVYHLSGDEIAWLKQNNVHDCVVEAMQAMSYAPPPPPGAVVVGEPPPPVVIYREPPPVIGVGFGYHRGW